MSDFITSTHRERWLFTPKELDEKRLIANQRALRALEQYGSTSIEVDDDGFLMYHEQPIDGNNPGARKNASRSDPLTIDDESLMRVYYEQKLFAVCGALKLHDRIKLAAVIYFKRFYLLWSIMEHHPKHIVLTCVYIACKTSENYIDVQVFVDNFKETKEEILRREMLVYKSLKFDLIVYGPYRSIDLLVGDIKKFVLDNFSTPKLKESDVREKVQQEINNIMQTDAPLIYPPGQMVSKLGLDLQGRKWASIAEATTFYS